MMPVFSLGGLSIPAKPFILLIGYYIALWLGSKGAESLGIDGDHVWNGGFLSAVGGLVVGRLAYAIRYPQVYLRDPLALVSPRLSTFVPWAAVLGGVLIGYVYVRRHGIPLGRFVDAITPALVLLWGIVALANLFAGDAYGEVTHLPWGVEMWGAVRHPTQLYDLIGAVLTLFWLFLKPSPRGQGIWGWRLLFAYSTWRLLIEAFRGDSVTVWGGYRLWQLVALVGALVALGALARIAPSSREVRG